MSFLVAPRVGAWIETVPLLRNRCTEVSHPVWVRGLKRLSPKYLEAQERRTPCGCVD